MPAATTTTLDPVKLANLVQGLNADVAQAQAVSDFLAAKAAAAQMAAGQPPPATADPVLVAVAAAELRASTAQADARQRYADARHRIGKVGVELYVGVAPVLPGTTPVGLPDRSVFLADVLQGQQQQAKQATRDLALATAAFNASRRQADQLVQSHTLELQAIALKAQDAARRQAAQAAPAAVVGGTTSAAGRPASVLTRESPSVLGPSVLSADELVGWYRSTGHQPRLTVPLEDLAAAYLAGGANDGVRADVAFAQSMVETGYFNFPAYGQVAVADNNFAGIGACDSCPTGLHFPNAITGVNAQMQLLHAYATTVQPVAGPLPGPFSVTGCCPTWMQLAGVWATALDYGVKILTVYRSMVVWALAHRRAAARF
jgi:hypothetical protein